MESNLPMSYKRYWMRKFEFTQRHAVHEHEISKRVFVFPKRDKIHELLENETTLDKLEASDFVDVEFRLDRLGNYTEQGAVNRIVLKRCWLNARRELQRLQESTDETERCKIEAVASVVDYTGQARIAHNYTIPHMSTSIW